MSEKQKIKVYDKNKFHYEFIIEHFPHLGFSNALYNDSIIGQVELNKIREPNSDNDSEWEAYEERFSEWKDEIIVNITRVCNDYLITNNH